MAGPYQCGAYAPTMWERPDPRGKKFRPLLGKGTAEQTEAGSRQYASLWYQSSPRVTPSQRRGFAMREPGQPPTRAASKLRTSRRKLPGVASCADCDALNPGANRERVRQHVKKTGHTAFFVIEDTTTYGPAGGAR